MERVFLQPPNTIQAFLKHPCFSEGHVGQPLSWVADLTNRLSWSTTIELWGDRFLNWRFSHPVPSSYQLRLVKGSETWRSPKALSNLQIPGVSESERVVEPVNVWWKWNFPRCFIEGEGIIFDPVSPVPTCSNVNSKPSVFHANFVSPAFNKTDGHISCPAVLQISNASVVLLQFLCMRKEMALENLEKGAGCACRTQWRFSVGDVWEFTQVWVPKSAHTCRISKTFLKQLALRRFFFVRHS